jgi:uncharacterized repeat protein (TIGR01451 family)
VTFSLTVTGSGTFSLAGGIFFMKDGTSTTGNVTLTVFNSASVALGQVTQSNSQFCSGNAHCQSYAYHTFTLPSPLALSPGSYTLVLSTDAPPQQNSTYFINGDGTSFSVVAGGGGGAPNLSISKVSSPANFTAGTSGAYIVQVTNIGNASSSGLITVMDTLGPNQTFVSAAGSGWSCSATGQVVTCTTSAVIAVGASAPLITITVNLAASAAPSVTNTVTVAGGGGTNTNNSFTLVTPVSAPDLSVLKTSTAATFIQGQNEVYTIQVNNVGNGASSGTITVTDTLDTNLTFVSASGSGWSCSGAGRVVTCTTSAVIAAGASAQPITLNVAVLANGESSVTNTGSVAGGGDVDTSNNSFRLTTPVTAPNLSVSKTSTPSAFSKGMSGAYTITATTGEMRLVLVRLRSRTHLIRT